MLAKFLKLFNIREEESGRAMNLFIYQFLVVVTMVQGRIIRDTLFLKRYDVSKLPLMYIGIAVIVSTLVFFYTKKSVYYRLDKLIITTLFASIFSLVAIVFLVKAGYSFSYPLLYIFVEIMGAFMMFQFWSFANELMDSREAKRILGFVGGGGVLASLSAGAGVRELVQYVSVENLLLVNCIFMSAAMYIVRTMGAANKTKLQRGVVVKTESKSGKAVKISVFSSPYVKYVAVMTAFIFIVVTFIDYQFKIVASESFSEKELASFLGLIYAVFGGGFSFLFQFFATSRLLKTSIFLSLGILPATITIFSGMFLVVPDTLMLFAYSAPLIAISMARASDYSFRYTVNDAAMQLLYIPLDPKVKSRAKAFIDGIIKPFCGGIAGLIIYLMAMFDVPLKIISAVVVIVGVLWIIVIILIRKEYLQVLVHNIKKSRLGSTDLEIKQQMIESIVIEAVNSDVEEEVLMALDMIEKGKHFSMGKHFIPLLSKPSPKIKTKILRILRKMEARFYTYEILKLIRDEDESVVEEAILTYGYVQMGKSTKYISTFLESRSMRIKSSAIIALIKYGGISGVMVAAPHLKDLSESGIAEKRTAAAYILGEVGQKTMQHQVFQLLNDKDPQVRRAAVKASAKIGAAVFIPKLFFMLLDKSVSLDVSRTLAQFGETILGPAMSIMENSIDSYELKSEVAKMLGDLQSQKAVVLLLNSLETKSDELRNAILTSMKRIVSKTEFVQLDINLLEKYLFKEFYKYFQTIYYKQVVKGRMKSGHLLTVLDGKMEFCLRRAFSLLALMYGDKLFDTIYFNISQKFVSKDQKSNALEIIDNKVDMDVRKLLIPIIETQDEDEKVSLGFESFKIKKLKFNGILENFLVDDSDWVRAITLHLIAEEQILDMSSRIPMFMYDPSPLVRETALYAARRIKIKFTEEDLQFLLYDENRSVVGYANYVISEIRKSQ